MAQPVEWKLHWLLRIGIFMEFAGHGAFGVRTKAGWLPFFEVFAIPQAVAWQMMPVIGSLDIVLGVLVLLAPRRAFLLYMAVWGTFTALLRPAAGQGWWEFIERSYNYGAPAALLALHGWGQGLRGWIEPLRTVPHLSLVQAEKFLWMFRIVVALMLVGHGGYGVFFVKDQLLGHYQSMGLGAVGLPLETWRAGIGFFEVGLGAGALLTLRPGFYLFVFGWKVLIEMLHVSAGAEGAWLEVIERGGCYTVPLAAACIIHALQQREALLPSAGQNDASALVVSPSLAHHSQPRVVPSRLDVRHDGSDRVGLFIVNDGEPAFDVLVDEATVGNVVATFGAEINGVSSADGEVFCELSVLELDGPHPAASLAPGELGAAMERLKVSSVELNIYYRNAEGEWYRSLCRLERDTRTTLGLRARFVSQTRVAL